MLAYGAAADRSGKTEQPNAPRARIVLGAADGKSNNAMAKKLKTPRPTVFDWRRRFAEGGVKALYDDRPRGQSFKPLARAKDAKRRDYCQDARRSRASHASGIDRLACRLGRAPPPGFNGMEREAADCGPRDPGQDGPRKDARLYRGRRTCGSRAKAGQAAQGAARP